MGHSISLREEKSRGAARHKAYCLPTVTGGFSQQQKFNPKVSLTSLDLAIDFLPATGVEVTDDGAEP